MSGGTYTDELMTHSKAGSHAELIVLSCRCEIINMLQAPTV
jgi:hypothetical protein